MSNDEVVRRIIHESELYWGNATDEAITQALQRLADKFAAPPRPIPQLAEAFPVVLYLRSEQDRQEFIALTRAENPSLVARPLP